MNREKWTACNNGADMFQALAEHEAAGPPGSAVRHKLVLAACECAQLVLPFVQKGDGRPLTAIHMAGRWARGEGVTLEQVSFAANDAANAAQDARRRFAYQASGYIFLSAIVAGATAAVLLYSAFYNPNKEARAFQEAATNTARAALHTADEANTNAESSNSKASSGDSSAAAVAALFRSAADAGRAGIQSDASDTDDEATRAAKDARWTNDVAFSQVASERWATAASAANNAGEVAAGAAATVAANAWTAFASASADAETARAPRITLADRWRSVLESSPRVLLFAVIAAALGLIFSINNASALSREYAAKAACDAAAIASDATHHGPHWSGPNSAESAGYCYPNSNRDRLHVLSQCADIIRHHFPEPLG